MAESVEESPEILLRSPEEGARRLALAYLDQAVAALPRLADSGDAEALHDLRVALRRLRSCIESYDEQLGESMPAKLARRLERLARATGPGRDAEVQLAWLREQRTGTDRHHRHHRYGQAWLEARLAARVEDAYGRLREEVQRDFAPVERGLRRRLSVYRAEVRLDFSRPPTFAAAAAEILHQHTAKLGRRLARVGDADDVEAAHQARISAKRLRYLADPLAHLLQARNGQAPPGELVHRLKELQDLLGDFHDAHVMEAGLGEAVAEAAAERARRLLELTLEDDPPDPRRLRAERRRSPEPGLLALARLNRARRDRLFGDFAEHRQGERTEQLLAAAEELAAALREVVEEPAAGGEEREQEGAAGQDQ